MRKHSLRIFIITIRCFFCIKSGGVGDKGFKAVDFGFSHIVALLNNGEVIAWGDNSHGQCDVPEQVFIQVYA